MNLVPEPYKGDRHKPSVITARLAEKIGDLAEKMLIGAAFK